jgi:catechol 2,3-dioxygenase-like lactoylglutathione lyase family enzyme
LLLEKEADMSELPKVHIRLAVSSLEKSRPFYEKFLGVAPVKVKPGYVKFLPPFGPLNLSLMEASGDMGRGHIDHVGFQVASEEIVVREMARVKAAGLPVREEFSTDCCHANQDKFWVQDPDGIDWEIYVLNEDIENNFARSRKDGTVITSEGTVIKGSGREVKVEATAVVAPEAKTSCCASKAEVVPEVVVVETKAATSCCASH